jgi:hypothetical protein
VDDAVEDVMTDDIAAADCHLSAGDRLGELQTTV